MKIAKALVGVMLAAGMCTLAGCAASGAPTSGGSASTTHASSSASSSSASSSAAKTSAASTGAATATITIKSFAYEVPKSVEPGAKITVKDADSTSHTVTSDSGHAFDAAVPGGGSATFTAPMKPGSYPFRCKYHANMHGVLVVKSTT